MSEEEDEFRIILTSAIPEVTVVRYYAETIEHITESHPEFREQLPSVMEAIVETVTNPTVVYRSTTSASAAFVFGSSRNKLRDSSMLVPVKVISGTSGLLKTAYFSDSVQGELIWKQSDES